MAEENCPFCVDIIGIPVSDGVLRCPECGEYYDLEDEEESLWDRSSRHKTRLDDGYDQEA